MITKGIGDIKSLHSINTRPGPLTEKSLLLRLYKLASEKANFEKKKEWAERQRFQSIKNLIDIQGEIGKLKKTAMEKIGSFHNGEKSKAIKEKKAKKWSEIPLRY